MQLNDPDLYAARRGLQPDVQGTDADFKSSFASGHETSQAELRSNELLLKIEKSSDCRQETVMLVRTVPGSSLSAFVSAKAITFQDLTLGELDRMVDQPSREILRSMAVGSTKRQEFRPWIPRPHYQPSRGGQSPFIARKRNREFDDQVNEGRVRRGNVKKRRHRN
jgi:hypothetical protein